MSDRFIEHSLRAFSDDLSSDAPVPGGGSAAAYAGAMGAALATMVGRISMKKDRSQALEAYIEETDNLRSDFLRLVDDNSAAYARVAEAMKLPRKTEEDKKERQERMQASLLAASRVPLEVAETARRLLDACERGVASASSSPRSHGSARIRGSTGSCSSLPCPEHSTRATSSITSFRRRTSKG